MCSSVVQLHVLFVHNVLEILYMYIKTIHSHFELTLPLASLELKSCQQYWLTYCKHILQAIYITVFDDFFSSFTAYFDITRICKSVLCIRFELYCVPIYTVRVNRFSAIYLLSQIKRCKMSQLHMLMTVNHTEGLSFSVVTSIFLYDIMQSQRYHFFVLLIVLVIKIMKCYSS